MKNAKSFLYTQIVVLVLSLFSIALIIDTQNTKLYEYILAAVCFFLCIIIEIFIWIQIGKTFKSSQQSYEQYISDEKKQIRHKKLPLYMQIENLATDIAEEAENNYAINMSMKTAELNALQSQINPHFLYNTLDSIRGHALNSNASDVAIMLEILASFFRYSINMKESIVTIADEIKNIKDYFAIQQYRFSDKLSMEIQFGSDSILNCRIPKMTLQPLVENAIFHGLERQKDGGIVSVLIDNTQNTLTIRVIDNGKGMSFEKVKDLNARIHSQTEPPRNTSVHKSRGVALWNINQRIKLLFGQDYGIHLFSTETVGTEASITLPYVAEYENESIL